MSDDWAFWNNNNQAIAVEPRLGIAVYANQDGSVVIRQQAGPYSHDEDDPFIFFAREDAAAVANAILALVEDAPAPKAKGSNAERQRRYRERHRNDADGASERNAAGDVTPDLLDGDAGG